MKTGQMLRGLNRSDRIRNRRRLGQDLSGLIQFVVCEGFVQERKESFAAVVIVFPWVFTVQHDGDDDLLLRRIVENAPHTPEDVLGRGFGRCLVVDESECVGDFTVAEQDGQRMLGVTDAIGLIERGLSMPWTAAHTERACEDTFVRGEPAKSGMMDKRKHLGTNRPF